MNGDGYDDMIVGASDADPYGRDLAGTSYVIFGHNSNTSNSSSSYSDIDLASSTFTSSGIGFKVTVFLKIKCKI